MTEVRAFRALVYDAARVGDLGRAWAPPYDVIDSAARADLAARHPNNVVRLILPEGEPDRYAAAAALLGEWVSAGVLVREREPAVWAHAHEFDFAAGRRVRTGVWAAVRLVEPGQGDVLPHERTLAGPKADRLALLRACRTQLSPVFFVAEDPEGAIAEAASELARAGSRAEAEFPAGERHAIVRAAGEAADRWCEAVARARLLIADGHHRYETALAFRDEVRASGAALPGAEWVLGHVVSERDPGLLLLPTHRVLASRPGFSAAEALAAAADAFEVERLAARDAAGALAELEDRRSGSAFVAWPRGSEGPRLLTLRPEAASRLPPTLREVAVAALHDVLLPDFFGLAAEAQRRGGALAYTRDAEWAVRSVREGEAEAAFLLRPPTFEQLRAAAAAGERFPQKTTYFAPKVPTGVALRPLDE